MGSSENWNSDIAGFITFYKYLLGIIGIWVLDEKKIFSRIRWFVSTLVEIVHGMINLNDHKIHESRMAFLLILAKQISTTVILSLEIIRHCKGYEDAMDAFITNSSSMVSISKLLLHRVNWKYKLFLVKAIIHDWTFVKNPSYSRNIMLKYARIGRSGSSMFLYFGIISCVSVTVILFFSLVDLSWISKRLAHNHTDERKLLQAAYCVFGKYISSVTAYSFIEALQFLQIFVNLVSQCGNDGFFFDVTLHVCGQFEILKTDFTEMNDDDGILLRDKLNALLKRHRRLIRLAYYLEKAFSMVILSQLLMSVVLLCVEGFQLILALTVKNVVNATKHGVFIVALLTQLLLYCFAGQMLEQRSGELAYAIYQAPWYNFDVSVIKDLSFVIFRANSPHQLTAGKFVAINFMSFKEILRASASYLSVLRVMIET